MVQKIKAPLFFFFLTVLGSPVAAQKTICDLPSATVADTLHFEASANCAGSRNVTWGALKTNLNLGSFALGATTITCMPPLLCNGGTSMDLSANHSLAVPGVPRWFNVKDSPYNALGNATNDDAQEIQAAIDAACATGRGGTVYLPYGSYLVSTQLTIGCAGVTLAGDGPFATTIKTSSTTANVVLFGPAAALVPCGGVRDLSINSSVTRTAGAAVVVRNCEFGRIMNVRIHTTGGNGLSFSPDAGGLSSIWTVTGFDIEISGAFTGIMVNGSNDQFFSSGWIRGTGAAGSKGIEITASGGTYINDVDAVLFEHGVVVDPGSGQVVFALDMKNVLADNNNLNGFRFAPTGTGVISGVTCTACWASSNGAASASGRGVYIGGGGGYQFIGMKNGNNGGHGLELASASATNIRVTGGYFAGNSASSVGTFDGIAVTAAASRFSFVGVTSGQYGNAPNWQRYGISVAAGADDYAVVGNSLSNNLTGGWLNTPGLAATRVGSGNVPVVAANETHSGVGSCTNQFVTALVGGSAPTCTTDTLAGPFHANQGTTTQVLHGNAAGNPSWGPVVDADVTDALTVIGGSVSNTDITWRQSASPVPTAEGRVEWDTDDDRVAIGTGSTTVNVYPGQHSKSGACPANQFENADNGEAAPGCAQPAHSGLSGLSSGDDHTQYGILAGRSGGQTLRGGTAASEVLELRGTAHATPGTVRVEDSAFVFNEAGADRDFRAEGDTEANLFFLDASADRIGIGTATPSERVHVVGKTLLDGSADAVQLTVQGHSTQTAAILTAEKSDGTDVLNVYATGVIEAPLIHNTGGTGTTPAIASGTWTPTLTGVTNVAASTAYQGQWMRVGNMVTASGKFDCDPTATTLTTLRISIPVASNFTATGQLGGGGAQNGGVAMPALWFEANATADAAEVSWVPVDAVNRTHSFFFAYLVQ